MRSKIEKHILTKEIGWKTRPIGQLIKEERKQSWLKDVHCFVHTITAIWKTIEFRSTLLRFKEMVAEELVSTEAPKRN